MARVSILALVCLFAVALFLGGPATQAEEKKEAKQPKGPPPLATDEQAAEALAVFKEAWKAKGLKGDDKISARDYAMRALAKVQHPDVVDALGKVSRSGDEILRMIALIYLGDQSTSPHAAARHVLAAMKKHKKDEVVLMTGLQSIGYLKYLGARQEIGELLKHKSYLVKKAAIAAIGQTTDIRMLQEMLNLIGLKLETQSSKAAGKEDSGGQPEVTEEGYSWEGVEVTYDTGTPGTHDQEMAERIGREQLAANRAAAEAAHAASSVNRTGAGSGNTSGGARGAQARSPEELIPAILRTLKQLTGGDFENPGEIIPWMKRNKKAVEHNIKVLDARERKQKKGGA